jgi:hypothetical protein
MKREAVATLVQSYYSRFKFNYHHHPIVPHTASRLPYGDISKAEQILLEMELAAETISRTNTFMFGLKTEL